MPHQCTNCGHTFADGSKEMLSGCPGCGGNTFQFHPKGTDVPDHPPDDAEPPPESEGGNAANTVGRAATKVRDFVGGADATVTDSSAGPPEEPQPEPGPEPTSTTPDPAAPWPDDLADDDAGGVDGTDAEIIDADARRGDDGRGDAAPGKGAGGEDLAQTSARGDVAGPDDLAGGDDESAGHGSAPRAVDSSDTAADAPSPSDGRVVSEPSGENPGIEELREQLNDQFESIKIVEPGQYELNLMELFDREEYIIALQENGRYVIQVPENWMGDRPDD
jgi:hypothetical protein